jgi:hypothetical protein
MLFKVQKNKDVFTLNPELKAIAEFEPLTSRQMEYVILAYDYKTPFRKLAWDKRKEMAALEAGYKLEKEGKRLDMNGRNAIAGKNVAVDRARKKYQEIQKDEDYETLLGLNKLISDIRKLHTSSDKSLQELEKAVKMAIDLPKIIKAKKEIEEILEMREDEVSEIQAPVAEAEDPIKNLSILAQLNDEQG